MEHVRSRLDTHGDGGVWTGQIDLQNNALTHGRAGRTTGRMPPSAYAGCDMRLLPRTPRRVTICTPFTP